MTDSNDPVFSGAPGVPGAGGAPGVTSRAGSEPQATAIDPGGNRWLILAGGVLVQLSIGGVYAWSTFSKAFQADTSAMRLTPVEASLPFELCIALIFVGAFIGGRIQDQRGPKIVAVAGVAVYAVGILMSSFAREPGQLWLLVLGYGVISGFGLGLAYIVPIAMLQKWFPDRAGLITGLAVAGFGFGAVITSPVAGALIEADKAHPAKPFLWLGLAYLVAGVLGASVFKNPPKGWRPAGMIAKADAGRPSPTVALSRDFTQQEALRTPQWYMLTGILALSVTAGISLISVAASSATALAGYSTAAAATLVGVMGLFNGGGRILWAALSDRLGKMPTFVAILAIQGVCLILLPRIGGNAVVFAVLTAAVYTCYGGAFGAMPSTAGRFFGLTNAGGIYGLMLLGWSIGGVVGPLLASWLLGNDATKNYSLAYTVIGIIALLAALVPMVTKPPRPRTSLDDMAHPSV